MNEIATPPAAAQPPSAAAPARKRVKAPYLTPAKAPNNRLELRPLPLRVAHSQYERLDDARNRTGISIQEHVRRAIDLYLAAIEKEAIDLGLMPERITPRSAAPADAINLPTATNHQNAYARPTTRKR